MSNVLRQPQQTRSIQKKQKIIDASYELFCEAGYFGTNTKEIAKRAGVSTGIVYVYFSNKRDLLICVLEDYIKKVTAPIFAVFDSCEKLDYDYLVPQIINAAINAHLENNKIHEVLHSLTPVDEVVRNSFMAQEDFITEKFVEKLTLFGESKQGLNEKVHLAMNLVQSLCHEYVFDKHKYIDYDYLKNLVIDMVIGIFKTSHTKNKTE